MTEIPALPLPEVINGEEYIRYVQCQRIAEDYCLKIDALETQLENVKTERQQTFNVNGFSLLLNDYCANCSGFVPEVEQFQTKPEWGEIPKCINNIRCQNRKLCAVLIEHLKKNHE